MTRIAIIPARAGSKRIPGKNIKEILGKPIIVHVINKLRNSSIFDDIYVSTDSELIAELAEKAGAKIPSLRAHNLSNDTAGTHEVVIDSFQKIHNLDRDDDVIACVYPTSMLIELNDIYKALQILEFHPESYVFTAHEPNSSPYRAFTNGVSGKIEYLHPNYIEYRSQDLPKCYVDSGQFYIATRKTWLNQEQILNENSRIIEIPNHRAIDLNTPSDWELLQAMISLNKIT